MSDGISILEYVAAVTGIEDRDEIVAEFCPARFGFTVPKECFDIDYIGDCEACWARRFGGLKNNCDE